MTIKKPQFHENPKFIEFLKKACVHADLFDSFKRRDFAAIDAAPALSEIERGFLKSIDWANFEINRQTTSVLHKASPITQSYLVVLPWNTCNASCSHCAPASAPSDRTMVSHERVLELIHEAAQIFRKPWKLSLSGGELFLHYNRLLEYCKEAYAGGGLTSLITNCFWARSSEKARALLEPLVKNGLRVLDVSYDRFHDPYIDPQYVKTAIMAARKLGIPITVRSVATRSNRLWNVMERLADGNLWYVSFLEMPCEPAGRAIDEVPADDLIYEDDFPRSTCPAAIMTINSKGEAMICGNSAGKLEGMNVGNIADHTLKQLDENFKYSSLVNFLRAQGPAAALEMLPEHRRGGLESKRYVSVCHLCHDIFSDGGRREEIKRRIDELVWANLCKSMPKLQHSLDRWLAQVSSDVE